MRKRWISLLLTAAMVFGLCGPMGALVREACIFAGGYWLSCGI